jgi:hypothetical protein
LSKEPLRAAVIFGFSVVSCCLLSRSARAEVELVEKNGWSVFSDGRFNGFLSYAFGDAYPRGPADQSYSLVDGGGLDTTNQADQNNKFSSMRIRSGFMGNVLGFGVKRDIGDGTTLKGYFGIWSTIETNRTRFLPINADVREGYLKLEGSWGNLLVGRALGLFSRGSVEIDYLYGHGYGLGYPCVTSDPGPTCGHIGFGVLFPFFAAGMVYSTPKLAGFTLTAGLYDPVVLAGKWERTPYPRPEAELAYDASLGDVGKLHGFVTALWQKLGRRDSSVSTDVKGIAGGGRIELGPFRLGVAAFTGPGLGFSYAIQNSQANYRTSTDPAQDGQLRTFDGLYVQSGLALGKVDLAAGWGRARDHLLDIEVNDPLFSVPKEQRGISAGVFYHVNDYLTWGLDYFRADFSWYRGETQGVNFINTGLTATW